MKIKNSELLAVLKKQAEDAAIYAIDKEFDATSVKTNDDDVKLEEVNGNNGAYKRLVVDIDDLGTQNITVRGNCDIDHKSFKLTVWKAVRDVDATPGRRAITKGQRRVYAEPA